MIDGKTTLERAFELAASGRFIDLPGLRRQLQVEGHWEATAQTASRSVARQLTDLIRKAAKPAA
jgi:hypothetical protein